MEQQNMLGAGMPQQRHMNTMQRPQPGNGQQQVYATIMNRLQHGMGDLPYGWQRTFPIQRRAHAILQVVSALRLVPGAHDIQACINVAESFERTTIVAAENEHAYTDLMRAKMNDITQHRMQRVQQMDLTGNGGNSNMMPNSMANMNNMNNMQNPGMPGMNFDNNGSAGVDMSSLGLATGQLSQNNVQQNPNFPTQLQRPMQPSPLPQQSHPQPAPQSTTMNPSALQNPQMMPQMLNMNPTNQQQQAMNANSRAPPQAQGPEPSEQEVRARLQAIIASLPEDRKAIMSSQLRNRLGNQQFDQQVAAGGDPLQTFLAERARDSLRRDRGRVATQANAGNMGMSGAINNFQQQNAAPQAASSNIDFSSITGLQANAIRSQESGNEVVPASNHTNLNAGAHMNQTQGVNPQMLATNNTQGGSNPNMQKSQLMQMQQRSQNRQQQAILQNRLAQVQAMQAQNNLRGQPGGLATPNPTNGGHANSPTVNGMSMLNRPMVPPGQAPPATPQQNRPQAMPQTPANSVSQLARHHQSMLNQNNQQLGNTAQGPTPQQRTFAQLPADVREKLRMVEPQRAQAFLQHFAMKQLEAQNNQNNISNMQQGNLQQNAEMAMPNSSMPPGTQGNLSQSMNSAVPNFTSQPPPNQQQLGQPGMDQRQFKQKALDMHPFPRSALPSLGLQVPEQVNTWGQLKEHIRETQNVLPPNMLEKATSAQNSWFSLHPEQARQAVAEFQKRFLAYHRTRAQQQQQMQARQLQQQTLANSGPPTSMALPGGQAPPAQMVPPAAVMQQQPPSTHNMNQNHPAAGQPPFRVPQLPPVTEAEVKAVRAQNPTIGHLSDEQIKAVLIRNRQQKMENARLMMQQAQQGFPNGNTNGNAQPPEGQQQLLRPTAMQNQQGGMMQGQKRTQTTNDDVVEIKNPASTQAPGVHASHKPPTQGDMAKMTPQQRNAKNQQLEALRKAQTGLSISNTPAPTAQVNQASALDPQVLALQKMLPPGITAEERNQQVAAYMKVKAMVQEIKDTSPKGPAVPVTPEQLNEAKMLLRKMWGPCQGLDRTYPAAMKMYDEAKIKVAMRVKLAVEQNCLNSEGDIKDYLSVSLTDLVKMFGFLKDWFETLGKMKAMRDVAAQTKKTRESDASAQAAPAPTLGTTQVQQQAQRSVAAPPIKQQAPPMNRKTSQTGAGRKQSSHSKAPPAPTENKSFDWGEPSPQGVPKYDSTQRLTMENLKFPPAKKRRTGQSESQSSTPAAQIGTPGASASPGLPGNKVPTPEQVRKMQPVPPNSKAIEPPRPTWKCDDLACEHSVNGFESEEALKQHKETDHKLIEDPLAYLLSTADEFEKAEQERKRRTTTGKQQAQSQPRSQVTNNTLQRQSQTVGNKSAGAQAASSAARPTSATPRVAGGKANESTTGKKTDNGQIAPIPVREKEKTMMEVMAEKVGFDMPKPEQEVAPQVPFVSEPEDSSWVQLTNTMFSDSDGFSEDWSQFDDIEMPPSDWSEAELTPDSSSLDSQSSNASNLSRSERLKLALYGEHERSPLPEFLTKPNTGFAGLTVAGSEEANETQKQDATMDWEDDKWNWELLGANGGAMEWGQSA